MFLNRTLLALASLALMAGSTTSLASDDYPAGRWQFDAKLTEEAYRTAAKDEAEITSNLGFGRESYIVFSEDMFRWMLAEQIPLMDCEWDVENGTDIVVDNCVDGDGKPSPTEEAQVDYIDWLEDGTLNVHLIDGGAWVYKR